MSRTRKNKKFVKKQKTRKVKPMNGGNGERRLVLKTNVNTEIEYSNKLDKLAEVMERRGVKISLKKHHLIELYNKILNEKDEQQKQKNIKILKNVLDNESFHEIGSLTRPAIRTRRQSIFGEKRRKNAANKTHNYYASIGEQLNSLPDYEYASVLLTPPLPPRRLSSTSVNSGLANNSIPSTPNSLNSGLGTPSIPESNSSKGIFWESNV
jgi:hypothetical protein